MRIDYTKRIFGLDIVRATAILMVVFSHMRWLLPNIPKKIDQILSFFGLLGVEIFFVLSGFLIGKIILNTFLETGFNFTSVKLFLKRRWFRTLPNYFLILIINIIIFNLLNKELTASIWCYFLFLHNFSSELPPFFMESWSLSIEEFAYLLLPFSLFLLSILKLNIKKIKLFKIGVLVIILVFIILKIWYHFSLDDTSITFWNINLRNTVIYRLDAIFYGVLTAYYFKNQKEKCEQYANYLVSIGVAILIIIHVLIALNILAFQTNLFFWNVLYFPIISIAIGFTIPYFNNIKTVVKVLLKPITFLSVTSYSIYLFHNSVVLHVMKHYFPVENLSVINNSIYCITYLIITLVLSYLLYRFFEKPMTNLRDYNSKKNTNEI